MVPQKIEMYTQHTLARANSHSEAMDAIELGIIH